MTWGLRFPFTAAALAVAVVILGAAWVGHINVIALPAGWMGRIELDQIGRIVAALLVVGVAFLTDQVAVTRLHMLARRDAERLQVVQRTIGTVHGIVNTCRQHLQLLRADAEGHVPPESLALFDEAVLETVIRLSELGDLEASVPTPALVGTGVDTNGAATSATSSADRAITRVIAGVVLAGVIVGLTVVRPKSLTTADETANAGSKGITMGTSTSLRDGGSAEAVNGDSPIATRLVDDRASVNVMTELVVATQPAGARVTVDGIGWGVAPVTIRHLSPGDKRIRVTKDGFATTERIVEVTEGDRQITNIRLRHDR